jgi:hypothetical protein
MAMIIALCVFSSLIPASVQTRTEHVKCTNESVTLYSNQLKRRKKFETPADMQIKSVELARAKYQTELRIRFRTAKSSERRDNFHIEILFSEKGGEELGDQVIYIQAEGSSERPIIKRVMSSDRYFVWPRVRPQGQRGLFFSWRSKEFTPLVFCRSGDLGIVVLPVMEFERSTIFKVRALWRPIVPGYELEFGPGQFTSHYRMPRTTRSEIVYGFEEIATRELEGRIKRIDSGVQGTPKPFPRPLQPLAPPWTRRPNSRKIQTRAASNQGDGNTELLDWNEIGDRSLQSALLGDSNE